MDKVYLLEHSYEVIYDDISEAYYNETKTIGIYASREKAEEVIQRYKNIQGFNKYPETCFYISEWLGIQKTSEESWEDNNYYQAVCEISKIAYDVKYADELAERIEQIWAIRFRDVKKSRDDCLDVATKILERLKLR